MSWINLRGHEQHKANEINSSLEGKVETNFKVFKVIFQERSFMHEQNKRVKSLCDNADFMENIKSPK